MTHTHPTNRSVRRLLYLVILLLFALPQAARPQFDCQENCFADFLSNLKDCQRDHSSNEILLRGCCNGATIVLRACIDNNCAIAGINDLVAFQTVGDHQLPPALPGAPYLIGATVQPPIEIDVAHVDFYQLVFDPEADTVTRVLLGQDFDGFDGLSIEVSFPAELLANNPNTLLQAVAVDPMEAEVGVAAAVLPLRDGPPEIPTLGSAGAIALVTLLVGLALLALGRTAFPPV